MKVPVPAGSVTIGAAIQKNAKNCRAKSGSGTHPQPPLFSTIDVSSLKAPTGNSFIGEGFCGHTPPHAAGNLLDCVSTMERALNSTDRKNIEAKMESDDGRQNTRTFIKLENDNSNLANPSGTPAAKVKVSQISVNVKPNCVKTGTPPLNSLRRAETKLPLKTSFTTRKSVSSPEAMSIGGDETTSSEKGSRSPSPFRSSNNVKPSINNTNDSKQDEILLDNDLLTSTQTQNQPNNSSERYLSSQIDSCSGCENDNVNGNTAVDQNVVQ